MVMVEKEQHLKMRMEHIRFGKEELERRRKSPVHIPAEHVAAQLKEHYHVYIVDPRLGFNQRTFRFWINYRSLGEEMEYSGKQLGHRHTVEAIIYIHQGTRLQRDRRYQVSVESRRPDLRAGVRMASAS